MANGLDAVSSGTTTITQPGPHPSFIQVATPYVFERQLREKRSAGLLGDPKETANRIAAIAYIDSIRPVKTFHSAAIYYHKFRLAYPDASFDYREAGAAALFSACKIEDTLKKSKDILCAAYNMRFQNPSDFASADDQIFEQASRNVLGIERLMLEACAFDFRSRHPHNLLMKMTKLCGYDKATVGFSAYKMHIDMYRTFAPLKHTTQAMAIACLELAARMNAAELSRLGNIEYARWSLDRAEVMEAMNDLLDLYTDHRQQTSIGTDFPVDRFLQTRIALNQEASTDNLPRFTHDTSSNEHSTSPPQHTNGTTTQTTTGQASTSASTSTIPPHQHATQANNPARNHTAPHPSRTAQIQNLSATQTPPTPPAPGPSSARSAPSHTPGTAHTTHSDDVNNNSVVRTTTRTEANGTRIITRETSPQDPSRGGGGGASGSAIGERGREGTVRFMLDPRRAVDERRVVKEYFRVEEIEEVVEV